MVTKISHLHDSCSDAATFYEREAVPLCTSVESLNLKIPVRFLSSMSDNLKFGGVAEYDLVTGEEIGEKLLNRDLYDSGTGIKVTYRKGWHSIPLRRNKVECVSIALNSKILKENYFNGIAMSNVESTYNSLMSHDIINCSFKDFMIESVCTDIDIKKDVNFTGHRRDLIKQLKQIESITKLSKKRGHGVASNYKSKDTGLYFAARETKNTVTAPFLKIYHKGIELRFGKKKGQVVGLFATKHLNNFDYNNLIRTEVTIKDHKHFQKVFGEEIGIASLSNILSLSEEQKQLAINKALSAHLDIGKMKESSQKTNTDVLRGVKDHFAYNMIIALVNLGKSREDIIDIAQSTLEGRSNRNRRTEMVKLIDKMMGLIHKEEKAEFCPLWNMILN